MYKMLKQKKRHLLGEVRFSKFETRVIGTLFIMSNHFNVPHTSMTVYTLITLYTVNDVQQYVTPHIGVAMSSKIAR